MSNTQWTASNYRRRKAERLALAKPEWVENPETGQRFYLRRVGATAALVAGFMPSELTAEAVEAWAEKGVGVDTEQGSSKAVQEDGMKDIKMMARIVSQACVIPKLVHGATADDELDPSELEDSDVYFIFRWATGAVGAGVSMKGGQTMNMGDLKSLSKKPGRRIRTGNNSQELRAAS